MKYLIAKREVNKEGTIVFSDARVVIASEKIQAERIYVNKYSDAGEGQELVILPVTRGMINIQMPVDIFKIHYPKTAQGACIKDITTNTVYAGIIVATIPKGARPSEEEILEFYYRGNIEKYEKSINEAKDDEQKRINLRRMREAIPYDRIVLDVGNKNMVFPMHSNYVLECK